LAQYAAARAVDYLAADAQAMVALMAALILFTSGM
jgi:hypothetical protein